MLTGAMRMPEHARWCDFFHIPRIWIGTQLSTPSPDGRFVSGDASMRVVDSARWAASHLIWGYRNPARDAGGFCGRDPSMSWVCVVSEFRDLLSCSAPHTLAPCNQSKRQCSQDLLARHGDRSVRIKEHDEQHQRHRE